MFRVFLELLGAFALPFLIFALALRLRPLLRLSRKEWTRDIVMLLGLFGLALCLMVILAFFLLSERGQGPYIPAHIENGKVVPGQIIPDPPAPR